MYIHNEQKEKIMRYNTNNTNTTEHIVLNKKNGDTVFVIPVKDEKPVFIYSVSQLLEYLSNNYWTVVKEYKVGRQKCMYEIQNMGEYLYGPAILNTRGLYCKDDALVKIFNKYLAVNSKRLNIGVDIFDSGYIMYDECTPEYVRAVVDMYDGIWVKLTDAMDNRFSAEIVVGKNRKISSMFTYINSDIIMDYCKTTLGLRL